MNDLKYFEKHVANLRESYINGPPRSRAGVARARISHPGGNPNLLIAYVSGIEGMARALALERAEAAGTPRGRAYGQLKRVGIVRLLEDHVGPHLGKSMNDLFGAGNWRYLPVSIEYRNLLAHEATYLGGGVSQQILTVAREMFEELERSCASRWGRCVNR